MNKIETKKEQMIDEIMENFDWNKCMIAMRALDWKWWRIGGERFPNETELKETARDMIEGAIEGALNSKVLRPDETYFSATGGLKATVSKNRYNHINYINLEFILSEWSSDGD